MTAGELAWTQALVPVSPALVFYVILCCIWVTGHLTAKILIEASFKIKDSYEVAQGEVIRVFRCGIHTAAAGSFVCMHIVTALSANFCLFCIKSNGVHMQAVMGTLVKRFLANKLGLDPAQIYHCAVMPCYDKKLEGSRDDFMIPGMLPGQHAPHKRRAHSLTYYTNSHLPQVSQVSTHWLSLALCVSMCCSQCSHTDTCSSCAHHLFGLSQMLAIIEPSVPTVTHTPLMHQLHCWIDCIPV